MIPRDADGNIITEQLFSKAEPASEAFETGKQIKEGYFGQPLGKRGFITDTYEGGKAFLRGAIRGTKDLLELPMDAVKYSPYVALPAEYLYKRGAATLAGFQDEKDEDMDYGFDTLLNKYEHVVEDWEDYSKINDIQEDLDDAFQPLFDKLAVEYESPITKGSEVFGEFLTTIPAVKAVVAGTRAFQIATIKPLIKESKNALTKELGQEVSDEVFDSPVDTYSYIQNELGQTITDAARREVAHIQKYQNSINKLKTKNKELLSLKRSIASDTAAAGAGAFAITYVESQAPDQAYWLAPLAGISAAVLAPPVLVNNFRAVSYNILGTMMKALNREDEALDMFIRARGMNPNDLIDEAGSAVIGKDALRKKKRMLLAATPQQLKFYDKVAVEINKLPDETKNSIYQSAITYKQLFDKFQSRAEAKGLTDVADSFVPLVHNVIQMAGIRSLQQALLRKADAGFFLTPKRLFQNQLSSEIDYLMTAQEVQIDFVRSELATLAKVADGDPTLGEVVGAMTNMVDETNEMFRAFSKHVGASGKNLNRQLALNTVGARDLNLIYQADTRSKSLTQSYNTDNKKTIENVRQRNSEFFRKVEERAEAKKNQLYDETVRDENDNYITITSDKTNEFINNIVRKRKEEVLLGTAEQPPTVKKLKLFRNETQIQFLMNFRNDKQFQNLTEMIEQIFKSQRKPFVNTAMKNGLSVDDATKSFDRQSGFNKFQTLKAEDDDLELAKFIHQRFINNDTNKQTMAGKKLNKQSLRILNNISTDPLFNSSEVRLIDVLNVKRRNQRTLSQISRSGASDPTQVRNLNDSIELMDDFLMEMKNDTSLSEYHDKLVRANTVFKGDILPLRAKQIMNERRLRKHYFSSEKAQEMIDDDFQIKNLTPEEIQALQNKVDRDNVDAYDVVRGLFDPVVLEKLRKEGSIDARDPMFILRSFRKFLDEEDVPDFQDSIMRSIVAGIEEGNIPTKRNGALNLTSSIDESFLKKLRAEDFITKEQLDELSPIVKLKTHLNKSTNNAMVEVFEGVSADLSEFTKTYKNDIASSFLNRIINERDKSANAAETAANISDLIVRIASQNSTIGVRTFYKALSDEDIKRLDKFEKYVFKGMDMQEAEQFRQFLKGETGLEADPFDRLLSAFEGRENGDKIIDSLSKIFTEAVLHKSFTRTDRASQLGSRISFGMAGKKFSSGTVYEASPEALSAAVDEYKPFFKAILRRKIKNGTKEDAAKFRNTIQELDDITKITRSVTFPIGQGEQLQGMPSPFSIESIVSRVYGVVRGVVSARYVFSEWGIRQMRQGQADVMKSFLTDPAAVHTIHNIFVKGRTSPIYMDTLFERLFSTPSLAILLQRMDNDRRSEAKEAIEAGLTQQATGQISDQQRELMEKFFG